MFSNPLKQAAEEYLYTNDDAVRERTRQQLVRAGTSAVEPLIGALTVTLRKLNSASWDKKRLEEFHEGVKDIVGPDYFELLQEQLRDMSESADEGMSKAQIDFSREACSRAWQVVSQIGEPGIRALFNLINGKDRWGRLAAMLGLAMEANPSRFILNLLITSDPAQEKPSEQPVESLTQILALRTFGLGGDRNALETIGELIRESNMTEDEFDEGAINQSIYLLAKSK